MQSTQFTNLQANLSEIYAAIHAQSNIGKLALYATSVARVYFQGGITGQILRICDAVWRWIRVPTGSFSVESALQLILTTLFDHAVHSTYDSRQKRIWNNIRQIDEIWKDTLTPQDFKEQRKRYASHLSTELNGSVEAGSPIYLADFDERSPDLLNEEEMAAHRHTIVNFHQATHIFWSLFTSKEEENIEMCQSLTHLLSSSSTLTDRVLFKALKKEGRWVHFEGVTQQSIPIALLAKLSDPDHLSVDERRCLKVWVQTLNRCQENISLKLFSCVLNEIMRIIHMQGSSNLTLADLIFWLDQQGCLIIQREDPAHMEWREKLTPGDMIECNGKQLILGQQLSPDKVIEDKFKIFEIENFPDYVVKIAHNRLILQIENKKAEHEQEHWGVRLVETIANIEDDDADSTVDGLDKRGRCVVQEKLISSFDSHIWTSQKLELTSDDEKHALVFANHLFCMSQWKFTSQNLSLAHLMWDNNGILKSTRLLKQGPANYNEWESYCESASQGNPYILHFLMHVSKLCEHKIALYYRGAVEHVLEIGETDLIGRPLPLGYRQNVYTEHVKKLCAQAQEIRKNCLKTVIAHLRKQGAYSYKQEESLQEEIIERIIKLYGVLPTPGRFPADFEEQVIASFVKTIPKPNSWPDPSKAKDYYQNQHELMMEYNKTCLAEEET